MSPSDPKDETAALVIRSAHELATRSSLVVRGLEDITFGFQKKPVESTDDSRSLRQEAINAPEQWLSELIPTLIVTLENWWTEPARQDDFAEPTRFRSFSFICNIESISEEEQLLGKHIMMIAKEADWIGEGVFVDFGEEPLRISPHSERRETLEISWLCATEKSDEECVRELLGIIHKIVGWDNDWDNESQSAVLLFASDGE